MGNIDFLMEWLRGLTKEGGEAPIEMPVKDVTRLLDEIERLRKRLEVDHYYKVIDGKMTRVDAKPGEIDDEYDGIACRDETIKLQDMFIEKQARRLLDLRTELQRLIDIADSVAMNHNIGTMDERITAARDLLEGEKS